jgi:hypothetical protein
MKKPTIIASAAVTGMSLIAAPTYAPGTRVQYLAHNAYPDHGKFGDRLDQALAPGQPFAVEEDLSWTDGKSLLIHGAKNTGGDDPTLESYFFPKVAPRMEQALKDGNKGNWPLITLYLDIKNDPKEHLEAIDKVLDKYDAWLTKAVKTADSSKQSPLELKPMMVLVEDKTDDIKQQVFYDRVPVGGKFRVFGSPAKVDPNPGRKMPKDEATDKMSGVDPEQLVPAKADNYHRWWGVDWGYIERGGVAKAGDWTGAEEQRLRKFVDYGHRMGYLVSVYCLDGYAPEQNQGWDKDYNFGSRAAAELRWKAATKARADFIGTDHYQEIAQFVHPAK